MDTAPVARPGDVLAYARVDDAGHVLDMARWQVVDARWVWTGGWEQMWRLVDLEDGTVVWIDDAGGDAFREYDGEYDDNSFSGIRPTHADDADWSRVDVLVHRLIAAAGRPLDGDWMFRVFGGAGAPLGQYVEDVRMDVVPVAEGTQATMRLGEFTAKGELWRGNEHHATFAAGARYPTEVLSHPVYQTPFAGQRYVLVGLVPGLERATPAPSWSPSADHAHPATDGPLSGRIREAMERTESWPAYLVWADNTARLTGFAAHAPEELGQPAQVRLVYGHPSGGSLGIRWTAVDGTWSAHSETFQTDAFDPTSHGVWSLADAERLLRSLVPGAQGQVGYVSGGQGWRDNTPADPRVHRDWYLRDGDLFIAIGNASGISTDASVAGPLGAGARPQRESWLSIRLDPASGALRGLHGIEGRGDLVELHGWPAQGAPPAEEAPAAAPAASMQEVAAQWTPAVAGAASLAILAFLVRFVPWVALYARLRGSDVIQHAARADILAAIESEPGISSMVLARRLQMSSATMRHHLTVLRRERRVAGSLVLGRYHWFPHGRLAAPDQDAMALHRDDTRGRLLRLLERRPDSTARALAASLSMSPAGVRKQLRVLQKKGLVEGRRLHGRSIAFRVV